ncbi:MAG: PEP-CTERM sorting domain-containing protein [Methylophilus sp.]|uniref:PEP-CTERM sorting domain-containing protein n=1 Tax=Methylophilus sp. TaxID=29541 RepID=UPI003FA0828B
MKKLALVMAIGLASVNAYAVDIVGLKNTGAGLSAGAQDLKYTVSPGSYGYVTANGSFPLAGNWLANDTTSSWLTPTANQGDSFDPISDGTYTWTTTFDLTGYSAATASFDGRFAADNSVVAYLNGFEIGTANSFTAWSTFSATAGSFVSGLNTLTFVLTNTALSSGNPTGLRVEFTSSNVAAVPEADTSALMLAGLGLMGFVARRKNVV